MHQVERAIFDLRRGMPVVVGQTLVYPTESIDPQLSDLLVDQTPTLVVSQHRLNALKHHTDEPALAFPLKDLPNGKVWRDFQAVHEAASQPGTDLEEIFHPPRSTSAAEVAALSLMRRALLLPAALTVSLQGLLRERVEVLIANGTLLAVDTASARNCYALSDGMVKRISEAEVPLDKALKTRFILFREPDGLREHVAVVIGDRDQWPEAPPVRLHSSCLTGDLFGSLRCDCGEQLQNAVEAIEKQGGGVLLYLSQEGRGIGLANKLRAYQLQDEGLDTVDADQLLGFGEDERRYQVAVDILAALNIPSIHLLTNNPIKLDALESGGIEITARGSLFGRVTDHNRRYLDAKQRRSGHWLEEVLERH